MTDHSDDVTVTLRLDEVFQEKAYVRLIHDGSREDYWYYMLTDDMDTDAKSLLDAKLADVLAADGEISGNIGMNKSLTFEGLSARTDYRVIAARISPAGEVIGDVAELEFVTLRDPDVFEVNDSWTITYKERKYTSEPYSEVEIFTCDVEGDDTLKTYIPCLLTKDDFKKAYDNNLRRCFEDYIAYRNLENVKWKNEVRHKDSEFIQDRLRHDDYVLFMIGVDDSGKLTGYYSRTDWKLEQEEPTEQYRAWLGKWRLTGKYQGIEVAYDVEISPEENNLYYRMYGWESLTAVDYFESVPQVLPIQLFFEKSTGSAYIISEELPDLADLALAEFYEFYLYGAIQYNGNPMVIDIPNLRLARMTLTDNDHAKVTPENFVFDNGSGVEESPFIYFGYVYTAAINSHMSYEPMTVDSKVPAISTISLTRSK